MIGRSRGQVWFNYLLLTIFLLAAVLPLAGILLTSLKTSAELRGSPFALPETWRWENYRDAWDGARFSTYFRSSVIVVVPVVVIATLLSTMSGYALGTMRFPGDNVLLLLIMLGLM
ncbi:MAG: carbohydrate ABC transporter permease, partial [Chloroflexi bacterium]|nr:carbohydrate ABC transporter permease [Chloroflexota bacterium]